MNWDWDKLQEKRQRTGGGGAPPPPDFSGLAEGLKKFRQFNFPGKILILVVVLLWAASGIYIVQPEEVGVVQRFGAFHRMTESGPHYHLPFPIESVQKPKVERVHRVEVGYRSLAKRGSFTETQYRLIPEESLMLTGDENIVDVKFVVQYKIKDAADYLFNISQQEKTIKDAAEAAMREVVGFNQIDAVLTEEKFKIQNDALEVLQETLDRYESGTLIMALKLQDVHAPKEVIDAFKDVQNAREDKNRFRNEAESYRNDLIPKTRGEVAGILNKAKGYKEARILRAQGGAARFTALYKEYVKAEDVTRKRLYLEAMEEILSNPGMDKLIFSEKALEQTVPYLPLDSLRKAPKKEGN